MVRAHPAERVVENGEVNLFDKVNRRTAAMTARSGGVGVSKSVDQTAKSLAGCAMNAFGVDDGPIGENLHELAELLAVVGPNQGDAHQDRLGVAHGAIHPRLRQDARHWRI